MPTRSEEIKKAIDAFENDDYDLSREILKNEINKAVRDKIKERLAIDEPEETEEFEEEDIVIDDDE